MAETEFEKWIREKEARRSGKRAPKGARREITKPKRKRFTSKRKPGFSEETRTLARDRAGGLCENPLCQTHLPDLGGEHHCLPRSQYSGDDRNDLWNCAHICQDCHARITAPKTKPDKQLRRYFEMVALARREGNNSRTRRKLRVLDEKLAKGTIDTLRRFQPFTK